MLLHGTVRRALGGQGRRRVLLAEESSIEGLGDPLVSYAPVGGA